MRVNLPNTYISKQTHKQREKEKRMEDTKRNSSTTLVHYLSNRNTYHNKQLLNEQKTPTMIVTNARKEDN